ncbi:MAG TPA: glycerate kinase [Kineosporiaceae bacterium]|nr:glycerate kinase [Kineosporiaceae bacterium]
MHVLIAPDSFDGTLTAAEAADAIASGWRRHAPGDDLDLCPLSDGGPGFVDAVHAGLGGRLIPVEVPGPLGEPALGVILLTDHPDAGSQTHPNGPTGYLESAQVCGLALVPVQERDVGRSSSFGLGVLIAAALTAGARRLVIGLGGVATNDGGAGLLAGLAQALDVPGADELVAALAGGGESLRGVTADQVVALGRLRERLAEIDVVAASDLDVTLLGFKGTSSLYAAQKGATAEQAQELDLAISDFARAALEVTGLPQRLVAEPGSGAAGGLGFGLSLLGARREPGASAVAEAVGLPARLKRVDVVITGEGTLDWQSLRGKVVTAVAKLAQEVAVPTVAVAGQVLVGRRELLTVGVESAYPVARTAAEITRSLAEPAARLADRAERVARTWSPRSNPA